MKSFREFRKHRILACIFMLSFGLLLASPPEVAATTVDYSENFDDTVFMDTQGTNASVWGHDSLRIAPLTARYRETEVVGYGAHNDWYIDGTTLYIIAVSGGVDVIDIADPAHPSFVAHISQNGYGIAVSGNWLYIASSISGLLVYNVTDVLNPIHVDTFAMNAWDIAIDGIYAYVATWDIGIQIYNITDPTALVAVTSYTTMDDMQFSRIEKQGDYLFALEAGTPTYDFGLHIVNVTDNENPTFVGRCTTPSSSYNLVVSAEYVYASAGSSLAVISLSNISDPTVINTSWMTCYTWDHLFVEGDYAFSVSSTYGLQAMDISNPYNLQNTIINPDALGYNLLVIGNFIYVSAPSAGPPYDLLVYELDWAYSATALSIPVYTTSTADFSITQATLTVNDSTPVDTSIDYYLSADNGTHWEEVEPGLTHSFINRGTQLKWKAVLQTTISTVTPVINEVNITIRSLLNPSYMNEVVFITYNQTNLIFEPLDGAVEYLFQLDTVDTFDSPNLINTTRVGEAIWSSNLPNGTYYYRCAGIDGEGDLGFFSLTNVLIIGTTSTTTTTTTTTSVTATPIDPMLLIIIGSIGAVVILAIVVVVQKRK